MFASQPLSALIDDIEEALKAAAAAAVAAADDAMTMVVDVDGGGAPGTAATPVVDELPEEVLVEIKSKRTMTKNSLKTMLMSAGGKSTRGVASSRNRQTPLRCGMLSVARACTSYGKNRKRSSSRIKSSWSYPTT